MFPLSGLWWEVRRDDQDVKVMGLDSYHPQSSLKVFRWVECLYDVL